MEMEKHLHSGCYDSRSKSSGEFVICLLRFREREFWDSGRKRDGMEKGKNDIIGPLGFQISHQFRSQIKSNNL